MGPGPMQTEYGQVSGWLERQQQRIQELEAENRELRRQLEELRRGVGVTVMIQGRAIPLAPVPAPAPQAATPGSRLPDLGQPAGEATRAARSSDPLATGYVPSWPLGNWQQQRPGATQGMGWPAPASLPQAAQSVRPAQSAREAPGPLPEEAWLTGSMRAVKASPRREDQPSSMTGARPLTPSQKITPTWLRDEPAREPATWDELAAQEEQRRQATGQHHSYQRTPVRSRPLAPRLEPVTSFPTLAQITGRQPAVRGPERERQSQGRNPYSDSFVLG